MTRQVPTAALAMLVMTMAACGTVANRPVTRASSSITASASASLASATPAPTASPTTVTSVSGGLACRLPLVTTNNGQIQQVGFLTFPGGAFAADPRGAVTPKAMAYGLAYDRGYNRWLPVDWRLVSDDGTRYVYGEYPNPDPTAAGAYSIIHIVNVATGADRILTQSGQYIINDYTGNRVYLTAWIGGHDGPGPQINWALDPSTGVVTALPGGAKYGYWIAGGGGWRTDYNTADPTVHNGPTGGNRIIRVDLATGLETTWFYQQGADWVQVLGFDLKGHPIVADGMGNTSTTWLLSDSAHRTQLASESPPSIGSALGDSNGIWLSDTGGTYLFTAGGGLHKLSSTGGQIAGGCH